MIVKKKGISDQKAFLMTCLMYISHLHKCHLVYILQAKRNIWDLLQLEELFESSNIARKFSLIISQLRFTLNGS